MAIAGLGKHYESARKAPGHRTTPAHTSIGEASAREPLSWGELYKREQQNKKKLARRYRGNGRPITIWLAVWLAVWHTV